MKKRIGIALFWGAVFCLLTFGIRYFDGGKKSTMRLSALVFPIMSTQATLKFYSESETEIDNAMHHAQKAMEHVVKLCNYFDPHSELAKLNASAAKTPFICSPELWELLSEVRKFNKISKGAFDPTIRPLMNVWGFHRKRMTLPLENEIEDAKKLCGFDKIIFDDAKQSVAFSVPGMSLDLGGIAKGWAIDKAAEAVLKNTSIRSGIIDLGGNMRCLPEPPPGKKEYTVAIKDPKTPSKHYATIAVLDECVATSGNYERYVVIDGKMYTHIINPRTGRPAEGVLSTTIVTKRGVDSDALSTSYFIDGALDYPATRALRIDSEGKVTQKIPDGASPFFIIAN